MRWKPIRFIPDGTNIPFMNWSRFGFFVSGLLCALAILLFVFKGLNYGIDFKGGTTITIRTEQVADIEKIRSDLGSLGVGSIEVQQFGSPNDVQIRIGTLSGSGISDADAKKAVKEKLGASVEVRSEDTVGPKVSNELTQTAILAVVLGILLVLVYLWYRFEWQFAVGAVLSLLHDTLLSIGLFSLLGLEFNLQIIAAILTIIGYSLNDTVVVFDRIREFLRKYKAMNLADLIDFSINSVLPRTILTSLATLTTLIALYIFGGEVIRGFAFAMIWGVIVGTYSSIFMAAPALILFGIKRETSASAKQVAAAARP
jgi:preprotein translocase subunit SecF